MTMTLEAFILYNIVMWTVGWYLLKRHSEQEYDNGFMDAVQLHNEGRLTYTTETQEDGVELITIEVTDE